ncbi:MAG: hypothetical protein MK108_11485 [Mariniblastus sp.]|nr:hypothetical protein [Mariniblastus sp.]
MNNRPTEREPRKTIGQTAWTAWCRFSFALTSNKVVWPVAICGALLCFILFERDNLRGTKTKLQAETAETEFLVAIRDGLQQQEQELDAMDQRIAELEKEVQQVSRLFDNAELDKILQQAIGQLPLASVLVLDSQYSLVESEQLIRVPDDRQMLVVEILRYEGSGSLKRLRAAADDLSDQSVVRLLKYPLEPSRAYRLSVLTRSAAVDQEVGRGSELAVQLNDEILFEQAMPDHRHRTTSQSSTYSEVAREPNVVVFNRYEGFLTAAENGRLGQIFPLVKQGYWCRLGSLSLSFQGETEDQVIAYRIRTYLASDAALSCDVWEMPSISGRLPTEPTDDPTLRRLKF